MAVTQNITSLLNYWADLGVFAYVIPFLLIFAVVYGILTKAGFLGDNKGVNAVIAIAVGLLALQFDYVSYFFARIFPYAGVGIAVLLVALILVGLFAQDEDWYKPTFAAIGGIIALVVVINSFSTFTVGSYFWWDQYGPALITLAIIGLLVWAVIGKGNGGGNPSKSPKNPDE